MNKMIELANAITRKGDRFLDKNGPGKFHLKACELLDSSAFHKHFSIQDIVESSLDKKISSGQNFKAFEFSDIPLTIARGKNCFVDIYFWRRRPTVIHNHHFTGALQCLHGKNVDMEFIFKKIKKIGLHHTIGETFLKETRILEKGSIEGIKYLDKFIHQSHHHADLTVNLCFRTPQVETKSLSNYLYSGLKYDKDQNMLGRIERLLRFVSTGLVDTKKLKLSDDDVIHFLMQTYRTNSQSKGLLSLRQILDKRAKSELGIDVDEYLDRHEKEFTRIENSYD